MRAFQFWILVLGATLVSLLMMKNVFIAHAFNREQRVLVQSEQMAAAAPEYETAWKTLAMHIYEKSRSDPTLADVLKNAAVQVRSEASPTPDAGATPAPVPPTAPMPSVPPKAPATP
jgi:hypothetical protein